MRHAWRKVSFMETQSKYRCPACNRKFGRTDRVTLVSNQRGETVEVGSDCGKQIDRAPLTAQNGDTLSSWNGHFRAAA